MRLESQPEMGTSISVEWYAVQQVENDVQREEPRVIEMEMKTVLKGEAGWIAC